MKVPAIGQTGGIFEIFVPGMFLILNIGGVGYICYQEIINSSTNTENNPLISVTKTDYASIFGKLGLSILIIICFSYLAGMVLRLLMTDRPDRLSVWYQKNFNKKRSRYVRITEKSLDGLKKENIPQDIQMKLEQMKNIKFKNKKELILKLENIVGKEGLEKKNIPQNIQTKLEQVKDIKFKNKKNLIRKLENKVGKGYVKKYKSDILEHVYYEYELWATEKFPYIGWLGVSADRSLPKSVYDFYEEVWAPRKQEPQNRRFFNFCKTFLNSKDHSVMSEIYAAESINRYLSGMFYSLSISCFLLLCPCLNNSIYNDYSILLFIFIGIYLFALFGIVSNFRFIRVKEAQIVFDASFKYRNEFDKIKTKEDIEGKPTV